ncbi:hypothetical protein [Acidithiobacillus albertensis]|uniref:hypothetical protein n=1 Tax=Acidithiobacillus albertensis TaxID=119978 RepID=UPI001C06A9E5|nr:hypothetical protein [Acidithiobacillus albertensis]MBU2741562.1 hypothetical protein [Acidithiobacillus albertensis]
MHHLFGDMATDANEKANPERLAFSILVPPPRVELGTNGIMSPLLEDFFFHIYASADVWLVRL